MSREATSEEHVRAYSNRTFDWLAFVQWNHEQLRLGGVRGTRRKESGEETGQGPDPGGAADAALRSSRQRPHADRFA